MPYKPKIHKPKIPGRQDERGRRRVHSTAGQKEAIRIRGSDRWKRVRRRFYLANPVCCDPLGRHPDQVVATEHVHHIKGLADRPDLAFTSDNLAPLCASCHNAIESMERRGQKTEHLFTKRVRGVKSLGVKSARPDA